MSLTLDAGGIYVLTGAAGAGKTTLLDIIALGQPPSQGRLTLFGSDPQQLDRAARAMLRRRIGIVFQDVRLIGRLTARANVALPLRIAGTAGAAAAAARQNDEEAQELLGWLGIAECAERRAAALCDGERRLVALARAIVGRPELLIADEPVSSADHAALALYSHVFAQVNRLGTTVLIATRGNAFDGLARRHFTLAAGRLATAAAATAEIAAAR